MLPVIIIFFQCGDDHLQVFFIGKKIGIARIHKKGFDIMLFDIVRIGFLQIEQVFVGDLLLVSSLAFFNIRL